MLSPFIDGRTDLYSPALVDDYFTILRASDGEEVERLLASHRLNAVLLLNPRQTGLTFHFEGVPVGEPRMPPLLRHLETSPRWQLVYGDELAFVFLRPDLAKNP